jgi:hypothetical protein
MIPATRSCKKNAGKSMDPAGKHRKSLEHGSSIPAENHWKKSEKVPAGILLSQKHRNYPEPAVSGPDSSTMGNNPNKVIV